MKKQQISVLTLAVFGAASAYAQIDLNPVPERAVGTPGLIVENSPQSPNLVAGREFYAPQAVALDNSVSPPILYVSDYVNNRVLAWKNSATFTTGQTADLVIGQPDLLTTFPSGPGAVAQGRSSYSTGLTRPSGLAVDKNGNLYVADSGNNRVLRFPKPFQQTSQFPVPDTWIGQVTLTGYSPNSPTNSSTPTATGLFFSSGNTVLPSSLAFDGSGNLWVLDTGNARVLRFNAQSLSNGGGSLAADMEIGQPNLTSNYPGLNPQTVASYYNVSQFVGPAGIAFDSNGNLYVSDFNRVMVFPAPLSSGMSASSNMAGVFPAGYTFPTSTTAAQGQIDQAAVYAPSGIFFVNGSVGVVDSAYNRIMIFPPFSSWTSAAPPMATTILGQANLCPTLNPTSSCKAPNNGNPQPSNSTFYTPLGAVYTGTDLYLVDSNNNRVLDLPQQNGSFPNATRILGQDYANANSPNLIEGREFNFTGTVGSGTFSDAGMAIDNRSGTPHLYVADPYNNRVLGFKDLRTFQNGGANQASIVLGQKDFTTALINYPSGNPNQPNQSSLYRPIGLLVDSNGNLYVADSLNGRVLRFPCPFTYAGLESNPACTSHGSAPEPADLVLGQQNFNITDTDPSNTNMYVPYGLAFSPACNTPTQACPAPNGLVVSDQVDNRVLYIPTTNGSFVAGTDNGKAATTVFGQPSFSSVASGSTNTAMYSPHHVSCDTNGNVYVADTGNNRVVVFNNPASSGTAKTGQAANAVITGLNSPQSVYVNPVTGEIWVANPSTGTSLRYTNLAAVQFGTGAINQITQTSGNFTYAPLATVQDQYGDLFVADNAHRISIYYPGVLLTNAASFLPTQPLTPTATNARALAPGTIGTVFPCANCALTQFLTTQNVFNGTYPMPTKLGDVEVLVNGVASPLYIVYPGQINFIVPQEAPTSGSADLEVIQVSTGQVLGATQVPMNAVAPGAFPYPGGQVGAIQYTAAINQDGTVNSATNPALRGSAVSLYMTGEGVVPGEPADGVQPTAALSAQYPVTVLLNGIDANDPEYQESSIQHILYSGINAYPGMWQVNVLLPKTLVPSGGAVWFVAVINGEPNWDVTSGFKTYIYVK